jgi:hypothetical protein
MSNLREFLPLMTPSVIETAYATESNTPVPRSFATGEVLSVFGGGTDAACFPPCLRSGGLARGA